MGIAVQFGAQQTLLGTKSDLSNAVTVLKKRASQEQIPVAVFETPDTFTVSNFLTRYPALPKRALQFLQGSNPAVQQALQTLLGSGDLRKSANRFLDSLFGPGLDVKELKNLYTTKVYTGEDAQRFDSSIRPVMEETLKQFTPVLENLFQDLNAVATNALAGKIAPEEEKQYYREALAKYHKAVSERALKLFDLKSPIVSDPEAQAALLKPLSELLNIADRHSKGEIKTTEEYLEKQTKALQAFANLYMDKDKATPGEKALAEFLFKPFFKAMALGLALAAGKTSYLGPLVDELFSGVVSAQGFERVMAKNKPINIKTGEAVIPHIPKIDLGALLGMAGQVGEIGRPILSAVKGLFQPASSEEEAQPEMLTPEQLQTLIDTSGLTAGGAANPFLHSSVANGSSKKPVKLVVQGAVLAQSDNPMAVGMAVGTENPVSDAIAALKKLKAKTPR